MKVIKTNIQESFKGSEKNQDLFLTDPDFSQSLIFMKHARDKYP